MTDPTVPNQPPVPPTPPQAAGAAKPSTILSLLSMIGGIAGLVLACCFGAGILFAIAGIVLGFLGKNKENARGMAMTGIITGFAGAALSVIMWILLAVAPTMLAFLPGVATVSGYGYGY